MFVFLFSSMCPRKENWKDKNIWLVYYIDHKNLITKFGGVCDQISFLHNFLGAFNGWTGPVKNSGPEALLSLSNVPQKVEMKPYVPYSRRFVWIGLEQLYRGVWKKWCKFDHKKKNIGVRSLLVNVIFVKFLFSGERRLPFYPFRRPRMKAQSNQQKGKIHV